MCKFLTCASKSKTGKECSQCKTLSCDFRIQAKKCRACPNFCTKCYDFGICGGCAQVLCQKCIKFIDKQGRRPHKVGIHRVGICSRCESQGLSDCYDSMESVESVDSVESVESVDSVRSGYNVDSVNNVTIDKNGIGLKDSTIVTINESFESSESSESCDNVTGSSTLGSGNESSECKKETQNGDDEMDWEYEWVKV